MSGGGAAEYLGKGSKGEDRFSYELLLPHDPNGRPVPRSEWDYLERFYTSGLPELTGEQLHAVLCYRDFARAAIARLKPDIWGIYADTWAAATAAAISHDPTLSSWVVDYLDRRFRSGANPDTLSASLVRTARWSDVETVVYDLERIVARGTREQRETIDLNKRLAAGLPIPHLYPVTAPLPKQAVPAAEVPIELSSTGNEAEERIVDKPALLPLILACLIALLLFMAVAMAVNRSQSASTQSGSAEPQAPPTVDTPPKP